MAVTNCHKRAHEGVLDMTYLERRIEQLESKIDDIGVRLDDLVGMLGEVLEHLGVPVSVADDDRPIEDFHGDDCKCGRHGR